MIPITRKDHYLNEIVGWGDTAPEKPYIEEEFFFVEILGEAVQAPEPLTRYQMYLAKIAGRNIEIPTPITRLEHFLARAAGMDIETPTPITKEEIFWADYALIELNGIPPLTFKSDGSALKNYRFYGAAGGVGDYDENSGKYVIPVTIAGKNKFDGTLFSGYYTDSTMTSIGGATGNYKSFKLMLSAGTYTFSCSVPVLIIRYITPDIYRSNPIGSKYTQEYTFTLANDSYVSLAFRNESNTAWDDSTTIQVELSQSATEYEPYREPTTTNLYLPEQIKKLGFEAEHIDYREQKMHKVRKNLLPVVATSKTVTGVTFTVNVDKSVTCNGRNRGTSDIIFEFNQSGISLEIGRSYIISGCPEGGAMLGSYAIQCYNGSYWVYDIGHGVAFPALGNGIAIPQIIIPRGVTVNNLTFYPMIRTANIEDDTYEPYIENTDLDVTLPALPIIAGTNTLSVGTTVQPSGVEIKGRIQEVTP